MWGLNAHLRTTGAHAAVDARLPLRLYSRTTPLTSLLHPSLAHGLLPRIRANGHSPQAPAHLPGVEATDLQKPPLASSSSSSPPHVPWLPHGPASRGSRRLTSRNNHRRPPRPPPLQQCCGSRTHSFMRARSVALLVRPQACCPATLPPPPLHCFPLMAEGATHHLSRRAFATACPLSGRGGGPPRAFEN